MVSDPDISESNWVNACREPEEESKEEPFKGAEMGFLKSPADVDPQEPIILKDAEVPPEASESLSPWASPIVIVIVPKKTAPGKPPRHRMCMDYRVLNSLLPHVDKAHLKAKGIFTLVPIPKIDLIYAKLEGSTIYSTFDMRSGYYHLELTPESQAKSAFVVGGPRGGK